MDDGHYSGADRPRLAHSLLTRTDDHALRNLSDGLIIFGAVGCRVDNVVEALFNEITEPGMPRFGISHVL